jgi:two-component system, OmpR family, phosphate regulon response regulator PhoB
MKKIIVAEDDQDILFILDIILNDAGYKVEALTEGTSIVNGKKEWPDLFILDKDLPTIDGFTICKYLRLNEKTKNIPIIVISAYHKLKQKAIAAGANDFVEKPFDLKILFDVVGKYLPLNANVI